MDWIVGVDEVGRGPLAGPVTVCVLVMQKNAKWFKSIKLPLRDSKKLSATQRELWLKEIKKAEKRGEVFYAVRSVGVKIIDKINIKQAADLAATRAFQELLFNIYKNSGKKKILKNCHMAIFEAEKKWVKLAENMEVILDAGLRINIPNLKQKSFPKADERVPAVSLASIVAKVKRDKYMELLDKKYPGYGFAKNKGYGTAEHYRGLKKLGLSAVHRLTFTHVSDKLNRK
jgi:ribonuclease HII